MEGESKKSHPRENMREWDSLGGKANLAIMRSGRQKNNPAHYQSPGSSDLAARQR